ncbi:unnamed protein product [Protopolystoma xenopodis]|uniref:Uncharacterized protein n=1 Tax=Protopolystoma xenopodis TaxID=117903 RepID=A0A3S5CQS1_9PLAT|nr:unnamed protein product [Protopolystoma xenopodis]
MHCHFASLSCVDAKLRLISLWQGLPLHGVAFFEARFETTAPVASAMAALLTTATARSSSARGVGPFATGK